MTFGIPPREFAVPTPSVSRHRDLLRTRRTIPRWPLLLLLIGTLAAGPVGLVVASFVAGALVVLRLRLIAADPEVSELPALPWTRRTGVPVLPGFTRTVGSVEWGLVSAFDFDTALRPRLTRVAAARLADRHGVDLSSQPAEAAGLLGAEAWALLDPARPPEGDRSVPGPDRAAVARVLDAIERV
jgi:hypothetical protein